jgi:ABC-type multidrug transport system ATPase subunit
MSNHIFTPDQIALHSEVQGLILTATKTEKESERTVRKAYTPEHDLQLLALLKEDGRAIRFGSSSTDEKKALCEELCVLLKDRFGQDRTPDSLYYRITKLIKADTLNDINYRTSEEGDEKPKAEKKPPKKKAEKKVEVKVESLPATTAKSEETIVTQVASLVEKVGATKTSDDDFLS